jgi:hypothetical protein
MNKLKFTENECVEIKTKDQYNSICHLLRNTNLIKCELKQTVYLEHANSVTRGHSIGLIFEPFNTWTNQPLTVLSLEEALSDN